MRCSPMVLMALVALGCLVHVPVTAQAQTLPPSSFVRLFATAVDANGTVVSDLAKDDFVILDDGRPRPTTLYQVNVEPITVIVMIDRSASMIGTFDRLVSAVDDFARTLGPNDQLRAGTFSDKVQFTSRFTSNRSEMIDELKKLPFGNGTKLHDALMASFDELRGKPGLRVVVAITDGDDTTSRTSRKKVLEREGTDDVVVYTIGLETQYFDGLSFVRNRPGRGLKELAEQTGGGYRDVREIAGIATVFGQIRQELSNHYLIGFSPGPPDSRAHTVTVQTKRSRVAVRARRSYIANP